MLLADVRRLLEPHGFRDVEATLLDGQDEAALSFPLSLLTHLLSRLFSLLSLLSLFSPVVDFTCLNCFSQTHFASAVGHE